MKTVRRIWHRIRGLCARRRQELELAEEFASHLAMQTEDNIRAGMDSETARREARIKFGSMQATHEALRDQRGLPWLDDLARDVRHGLRSLRCSPAFTIVVVLMLALGIGATSAIFSVLNVAVLSPLPFPDADRLVRMMGTNLWRDFPGGAEPLFLEWRRRSQTIELIDRPGFTVAGVAVGTRWRPARLVGRPRPGHAQAARRGTHRRPLGPTRRSVR